jgi:hypothetical protein
MGATEDPMGRQKQDRGHERPNTGHTHTHTTFVQPMSHQLRRHQQTVGYTSVITDVRANLSDRNEIFSDISPRTAHVVILHSTSKDAAGVLRLIRQIYY